MNRMRWAEFDYLEVRRLTSVPFDIVQQTVRTCPSCAQESVRLYSYESDSRGKPISIAYAWCHNCHKYKGSTSSSLAAKFTFDDPAEQFPKLARLRSSNLMEMLDYLDSLWERQVLPQTFVRKSGK